MRGYGSDGRRIPSTMNNSLLKSITALVIFYGAAALLWLMLLPPNDLISLLAGLPDFMRPEVVPKKGSLNFLQLEETQKVFLEAWSLKILQAWLIAAAVGIVLTALVIFLFLRHRRRRKNASGSWRSLGVTIGPLPVPEQLPRKRMKLTLKGIKLTKDEDALLEEILGTLAAHPGAYVGAGHGTVSLHEHTLGVVETIMSREVFNADHVLAAAAHDMGKITSFIKGPDGSWERVKMHAQESARMLAVLPAWGRLPLDQREAIRLAVKNEHSPNMIPGIDTSIPASEIDPMVRKSMASDFRHPLYDNPTFRRRVVELVTALRDADGVQTAAEKKVVLSEIGDLPGFCLQAFLKALPTMPFYYQGVPPGTKGMVWQYNKRLYISEAKMRDYVMSEALSDEHHAALGGTYRGPKTIAPFTWHLLEAFKQKGWLVTKAKCYTKFHKSNEDPGPLPVEMECQPEMPLWDVLSGNKVLNGMIIIDVTDADVLARTPQKDLGFAIGPHRPHQPSSGAYQRQKAEGPKLLTREEMDGGLERSDKPKGPAKGEKKVEPKVEVPVAKVTEGATGGGKEAVSEPEATPERPPRPADLVASEAADVPVEPSPAEETIPPAPEVAELPEPAPVKPAEPPREPRAEAPVQPPPKPKPAAAGPGGAAPAGAAANPSGGAPKPKPKNKPKQANQESSPESDYMNDLLR